MMKRLVTPISLFICLFVAGGAFMYHTFIHQGQFSLFLLTQDYFVQAFREPFPVSYVLSSFLAQFYDIPLVGAVFSALMAVCIYFMAGSIIRRVGLEFEFPAVLLSCGCWLVSSLMPSPQFMVASLFVTGLIFVLSRFFRVREVRGVRPCRLLSVLVVSGCCAAVALVPEIRRTELHGALEYYARQHKWEKVLEYADCRAAGRDRSVIPYAMLALNAQGRLMSGMKDYPVKSPSDLDMEGVSTLEGYWFSSILDECLGNYNEALHHVFQASCTLPQGMSLVSLYQMIRFNIENENYTMVRKYAGVLKRNPRNRALAVAILKRYGDLPDREDTVEKQNALTVTNSPIYNLAALHKAGIQSEFAQERLAAYLTLLKNE